MDKRLLLISGIMLLWTMAGAAQQTVTDDKAKKVTNGFSFTEGPFWHSEGYLLFSDIPANTIYKWIPGSMESQIFLKPSGHSNGIAMDSSGRLILVQHDGKVSAVNTDKKMVLLADSYRGKRFNSPNDLTIASDGRIYFTDPPFGVSDSDKELMFSGVYLLREGEEPEMLFDGFQTPNGIVLNESESKIFVNDSQSGDIMVFEIADDGTFEEPELFASVGASAESGSADGMVMDREGRLYSTGPAGIHVFNASGEQIEKIDLPVRATNMAWGGDDNKTLFITTPSAIYKIPMKAEGINK